MSQPSYRALQIALRILSVLLAIGAVNDFQQPRVCNSSIPTPSRGGSFDFAPLLSEVESSYPQCVSPEVALMETPKALDSARGEMIFIGRSVVIKGDLSCGEDLYIGGRHQSK
jgi:hypothetical protein